MHFYNLAKDELLYSPYRHGNKSWSQIWCCFFWNHQATARCKPTFLLTKYNASSYNNNWQYQKSQLSCENPTKMGNMPTKELIRTVLQVSGPYYGLYRISKGSGSKLQPVSTPGAGFGSWQIFQEHKCVCPCMYLSLNLISGAEPRLTRSWRRPFWKFNVQRRYNRFEQRVSVLMVVQPINRKT